MTGRYSVMAMKYAGSRSKISISSLGASKSSNQYRLLLYLRALPPLLTRRLFPYEAILS